MKTTTLLLSLSLLAGCGAIINLPEHKSQTDDTPSLPTPPPLAATDTAKTFDGYVGGAFAVTVDGTPYSDMEDFYTKEQAALPQKVKAAGYDSSWTARFDAQLGLADLWNGMTVYLSPEGDQGFQGEATVEESGKFSITLPPEAVGHNYQVRANKRIGILLTRGADQVSLCYNFSAIQQSVPFDETSLPIVLKTFASTITTYDCNLAASDGISVPANPSQPRVIQSGEMKSDVARILGLTGLAVQSETQWCWAYRTTPDSPCTAKATDGTSCDCSVTFDASGSVTSFSGIAASYLRTGT